MPTSLALHRLTHGLAEQGVDVSAWPKELLLRRLKRSALIAGEMFLDAHVDRLLASQEALDAFVQGLASVRSAFFADAPAFAALEAYVAPAIARRGRPARALCLGCGRGHDAWSAAMLLSEKCELFEVNAFDPSELLLAEARDAEYGEGELENVAFGRVRRWFVREGQRFTIAADLRAHVSFERFDHGPGVLPGGLVPGSLDLVICRGGMCALWVESRTKLLDQIALALAPGGALLLGKAEHVERSDLQQLMAPAPLYLKPA